MFSMYLTAFVLLVILSAFFSSAETSLLSLNRIKLNHRARKKSRKALLLREILKTPDDFFSTILIGNNLVNIAAASITTLLFSHLLTGDENLILLVSTTTTTLVILIFAEVLPKTYAFRFSEKLAYVYAYPIKFFKLLFYPFVVAISLFSGFIFRRKPMTIEKKDFSAEEIKHFLESEIQLFKYNPETLRIIHEIIDIAQKDIRSIMTPRPSIIALNERADLQELKSLILKKGVSKIPLYHENLNTITGIVLVDKILDRLMTENQENLRVKDLARPPIFISEYSSINYVLREFKKYRSNLAVIVDEYGATIGIVTINDIFREIFEGIETQRSPIKKMGDHAYLVDARISVEELNFQLNLDLPDRKDYATLAGLFIYHYGKLPKQKAVVTIGRQRLQVTRMGRRKILQVRLERTE